jgi:hypothetical protein
MVSLKLELNPIFIAKSRLMVILIVEILNGSSQGKKARIQEMIWHYKKQRVFYQLEVDGKIKSKRYWKEDFKLFVDS